jgi:hypothetical protein
MENYIKLVQEKLDRINYTGFDRFQIIAGKFPRDFAGVCSGEPLVIIMNVFDFILVLRFTEIKKRIQPVWFASFDHFLLRCALPLCYMRVEGKTYPVVGVSTCWGRRTGR